MIVKFVHGSPKLHVFTFAPAHKNIYLGVLELDSKQKVEITKSKRFIDSPFLYDSIL